MGTAPAPPPPPSGAGAVDQRSQVLVEVYWQLHDHADAYRATKGFRRSRERWEAGRADQRLYAKHVIHEFHTRGIDAAAREVAELLGVPEHEIERPEVPAP